MSFSAPRVAATVLAFVVVSALCLPGISAEADLCTLPQNSGKCQPNASLQCPPPKPSDEGFEISDLFINPSYLSKGFEGFVQVIFLLVAYAYVLFFSSNLISDGSELLLLIPSLSGIVGSVVLPVLGAVPDGAIVLFSGLGPGAQEQLAVGVGALAGSTIMLLTIPWGLSIIAGRVTLNADGTGTYVRPKNAPEGWSKLSGSPWSLMRTGVNVRPSVAKTGKIMVFTCISYLIIQGPAFAVDCWHAETASDKDDCKSRKEKTWALIGFIVCMVSFIGYLVYQVKASGDDEVAQARTEQVQKSAIANNVMSLRGVAAAIFGPVTEGRSEHLLEAGEGATSARLRELLKPFFKRYDTSGDGRIDHSELRALLIDLHENPAETNRLMEEMDKNKDGSIDFQEFCQAMDGYLRSAVPQTSGMEMRVRAEEEESMAEGQDSDDEEEEDEVPEDLAHLSPKQQQVRILLRASWMMGLGTFLVLLFSDPMVGVLSEFGAMIGVNAFYVSFVLAPLASNASELIASYNYALKKTTKSITISFAALEGAACMNNTFCLGIFLALLYFENLKWEYSAETISILFVQLVMFCFSFKRTHRLLDALLVFSLYPISLVLVIVIEKAGLN